MSAFLWILRRDGTPAWASPPGDVDWCGNRVEFRFNGCSVALPLRMREEQDRAVPRRRPRVAAGRLPVKGQTAATLMTTLVPVHATCALLMAGSGRNLGVDRR